MCQGVGIRTNALIDDDIYDLGWLITPTSVPSNNFSKFICAVNKDGIIDCNGIEWPVSYRPILNLKSSILVPLNKD